MGPSNLRNPLGEGRKRGSVCSCSKHVPDQLRYDLVTERGYLG